MKYINTITDNPKQFHLIDAGGEIFEFELIYKERVMGFFYNLNYKDKKIKNQRLVLSSNILNQFKNIFPFGLRVHSVNELEPIFIDDLINGKVKIYLLGQDELF